MAPIESEERHSGPPFVLCLLVILLVACGNPAPAPEISSDAQPSSGAGSQVTQLAGAAFSDVTEASGFDFVHFNGMSGQLYFPELLGSGAALLDYDNDGDLDIYTVQGTMIGPHDLSDSLLPPAADTPLSDRLWRNDLIAGTIQDPTGPQPATGPQPTTAWHFTDVTSESGLRPHGYGMGVASGDFDNDGWTDLYITRWGPNQLLRNRRDGTFEDVTLASGTDDPNWSVPAVFVDFDRDGWLDLFVGNYVDFRLATHHPCYGDNGALDYCGPLAYPPQPDRLFRNRGDGTFEDVSATSRLRTAWGSALGVVTGDFDGDLRPDLYVANDEMPNLLWMNRGPGGFEEMALLAGCALSGEGIAESSMGVAVGDVDGDGDEDLFISHLDQQTNTLYRNNGRGLFKDVTAASQLAVDSWHVTGFGTAFFDYDNDGWLDLFVANGAVQAIETLVAAGDPFPLRQANQLFRNLGQGRFVEVSAANPAVSGDPQVSRGAAFGDLDNDGDTDVLVLNNSAPAQLLRNDIGQQSPWLGLSLVDERSSRHVLGARVDLQGPGIRTLLRRARTDGSYASANDPRILVGLGGVDNLEAQDLTLVVTWPDGQRERWPSPPLQRYSTLVRGSGQPVGGAAGAPVGTAP